MRHTIGRYLLIIVFVAVSLAMDFQLRSGSETGLFSTAEAVVGRPATPVSYAGVARRTPVKNPGNRGGPVNRVGRR